MNDLVKIGNTQNLTMSSLEIAELRGKEHCHVMRDIRDMLARLEISESEFGQLNQFRLCFQASILIKR